jgi:hypothetical protein
MANFKFFKFAVWNKAEQMALLDLPSSSSSLPPQFLPRVSIYCIKNTSLPLGDIKGTVQRKLRGVKSGINQ